jgi:protein SCO1/2
MRPAALATGQPRRAVLAAGLATLAAPRAWAAAGAARPEPPTGAPTSLQAAPPLVFTDGQGRTATWPALMAGGLVTAVQTIFTTCSSTCPTQGQFFAVLAARQRVPGLRCLSLSIDALGDDPPRLAAWQARFGAHPAWRVAVPRVADVDTMSAYLRGGEFGRGTHTTQVFLFDRHGRLAWRTGDHPSGAEVEAMATRVARG